MSKTPNQIAIELYPTPTTGPVTQDITVQRERDAFVRGWRVCEDIMIAEWCEINGGGVITKDQLNEMINKNKNKMANKHEVSYAPHALVLALLVGVWIAVWYLT